MKLRSFIVIMIKFSETNLRLLAFVVSLGYNSNVLNRVVFYLSLSRVLLGCFNTFNRFVYSFITLRYRDSLSVFSN